MYEVDDGRAELGRLHNVRIVMTPADTNFMYTNINRMSNHRLGATVIYDESEIFYDVGVRLKGSAFGRNNDSVAGLSMQFHPIIYSEESMKRSRSKGLETRRKSLPSICSIAPQAGSRHSTMMSRT